MSKDHNKICNKTAIKANFHFPHYKSMEIQLPQQPKCIIMQQQ